MMATHGSALRKSQQLRPEEPAQGMQIGSYLYRAIAMIAAIGFSGLLCSPAFADTPTAADHFENSIRPLLAERCFGCHGPKKQWASLRLDSLEGMLKGGDTAPAIVAGKPEESELIKRIQEPDEDLRMPPAEAGKPLSAEQIQSLAEWIRQGAIWPDNSATLSAKEEAWKTHWAFQPVKRPDLPAVQDKAWAKQPLDYFIEQRLEAAGLNHSPEADRRTLIRRATYDLTGLPPTAAEVADFQKDKSAEAYDQLVDRLLASSRFGEKWGRHWLDVARYSDSKGYVYAREQRFFVQSAAYRDWVIGAFNKDLPYDQFLLLQLAAEQLTPENSPDRAAMGYLTLGRRFLGVPPDIFDDRIDVVSRGLLGLTVGCARCHDHKYDPIPTADYYSLYGVFQNCGEKMVAIERAANAPSPTPEVEKALLDAKKNLSDAETRIISEAEARIRQYLKRYLLAQRELDKYPDAAFNQVIAKSDLIPLTVWEWVAYLKLAEERRDPIMLPWLEFTKLDTETFATEAPRVTAELKAAALHPLVAARFEQPPATIDEVAERYSQLFGEIDTEWQTLCSDATKAGSPAPQSLPDANRESLRQVLYGPGSPCVLPKEAIVNMDNLLDSGSIGELWKLQNAVDQVILQSPTSVPHAVVLQDRPVSANPFIFRRGTFSNRGPQVPRQFLQVVAGPDRKPFEHGSGRLEMAQAIVDPANPLTARVWVNRVWLQLLGEGLVKTPSDFGMRAESPSHPELLDYLSSELVANKWSTKQLIRSILLSATYRQRSRKPDDAALAAKAQELDPGNRLLWRMNAKRLSFEEFRDTVIALASQLDETAGGKGDELFPAGGEKFRRSVYGSIDRQFLPNVLRVFDFANPDLHCPQRSETTIPQQALFALNHPFIAARAKAIAKNVSSSSTAENVNSADVAASLQRLYQTMFQREPSPEELQLASDFVSPGIKPADVANAAAKPSPWSYGYGAIEPEQKLLQSFEPIPYFGKGAWTGGPNWPDAKIGWVQLTPTGGHPGDDLQHAVIRRWTATVAGKASIKSEIIHEPSVSDGIRYWVFSSRHGLLASAPIHHTSSRVDLPAMDIQPGDTIDFVVDILRELNSDQFLWSPTVTETCSTPMNGQAADTVWEAATDFPAAVPNELTHWEQLAQLLLLSNELMFVD